jgi:hypothetical protein
MDRVFVQWREVHETNPDELVKFWKLFEYTAKREVDDGMMKIR